jgi:SMODS and SLOG-associating 2TM effector domain 2
VTMNADDLRRAELERLDWSSDGRTASLTKVYEHARGFASDGEQWYAAHRRDKRRWARILRVAAILLGTVAAVIPILSEIYTTSGKPAVSPAWSAVALAVAAGLVALDRYFGFSAGWIRYMGTEFELTRLRHGFTFDWETAMAKAGSPPDPDEALELLELARQLVLKVDELVIDETKLWTTEFKAGLDNAEKQTAGARHGA